MSFRPYVPPTIGKKPSRRQFRRARAARPLRTAFDRRANRRSEPFASCAPDPAFICRPFACSRASAFWGRERLFSRRRDHCRPSPRRPLGGWVLCRARMPFRRRRGVPRIDPPRPRLPIASIETPLRYASPTRAGPLATRTQARDSTFTSPKGRSTPQPNSVRDRQFQISASSVSIC